MNKEKKINNRIKRKMHIRKNIYGSASRPRVTVFRSNKHIYAQAIDDVNSKTLFSASDYSQKSEKGAKTEKASEVGKELGKVMKKEGVSEIVFDRNGYKYHGKVKALAEGIRESGIKF